MNPIWQSELLLKQDWLVHGTATLAFGSTRYPNPGEDDSTAENRGKFLRALGVDPSRLVVSGNTHGKKIEFIGTSFPFCIPDRDGIVTSTPSIALATKTADCLPVFLADPTKKTVAVVHAGWKGVMAGIVIEAVRAMTANHPPRALVVAIGPSIGPCCYAIHDERRDEMMTGTPFIFIDDLSGGRVDLRAIVVRQLAASGIVESNIDASAPCTACYPDVFASYHLSRDPSIGTLSAIAIR